MSDVKQTGPGSPVLDIDRLLSMAEQIGAFFAPYPDARAAEGVRNHLRTYWDPRMREALLRYIEAGAAGLPAHVIAGARLLKDEHVHSRKGYYGPPQP